MSRVPQIAFPALAAVALLSTFTAAPSGVLPPPATSTDTPTATIAFADAEKLVASSCRATTLRVLLTNGGPSDVLPTFDAVDASGQKAATVTREKSNLLGPGRHAVSLKVLPEGLPCQGWRWFVRPSPNVIYLGVSGTANTRRDVRPLRLAESSPVGWLPVVGGLVLSVIVTLSAALRSWPKGLVLDQPIWGASSASNLALGAALLTALLASVPALETMRLADRATYTQLSLLFGALIAASPLVFGLRSTMSSVMAFLAAAALTLWAAFGQLMAAVFLLFDLQNAGVLPEPSAWIFGVLCACLIVLLMKYGHSAITGVLSRQTRGMAVAGNGWELL